MYTHQGVALVVGDTFRNSRSLKGCQIVVDGGMACLTDVAMLDHYTRIDPRRPWTYLPKCIAAALQVNDKQFLKFLLDKMQWCCEQAVALEKARILNPSDFEKLFMHNASIILSMGEWKKYPESITYALENAPFANEDEFKSIFHDLRTLTNQS